MAKMQILFDGFEDLAAAIDRSGGDLKPAVNEALTKTSEVVQNNLIPAAAIYARKGIKGYATGKMYGTLITGDSVQWEGTVASIKVGFNLNDGGWHSIFVMYGTPRMAKDQKIYNAIKGTKTRKDIADAQAEVMKKYLDLAGN